MVAPYSLDPELESHSFWGEVVSFLFRGCSQRVQSVFKVPPTGKIIIGSTHLYIHVYIYIYRERERQTDRQTERERERERERGREREKETISTNVGKYYAVRIIMSEFRINFYS